MNVNIPSIELPFPYRGRKSVTEGVNENVGRTYKYGCAMLNLSDDISPILRYWCKKNISDKDLYINEDEGIDGFENNKFHVTVKYGLHTSDPKEIIKLVNGCGAIELDFGNVTKFDINPNKFDVNPNFDVLKIDIKSDKLRKLNKLISDNMEHTDSFDNYVPHATLAYVKKGACEDLVNNDFFTSLTDTVDEIYFTGKDGVEHFIDL